MKKVIRISQILIILKLLSRKCPSAQNMKWLVMDITKMTFDNQVINTTYHNFLLQYVLHLGLKYQISMTSNWHPLITDTSTFRKNKLLKMNGESLYSVLSRYIYCLIFDNPLATEDFPKSK